MSVYFFKHTTLVLLMLNFTYLLTECWLVWGINVEKH